MKTFARVISTASFDILFNRSRPRRYVRMIYNCKFYEKFMEFLPFSDLPRERLSEAFL